jgi:hypothetical protein
MNAAAVYASTRPELYKLAPFKKSRRQGGGRSTLEGGLGGVSVQKGLWGLVAASAPVLGGSGLLPAAKGMLVPLVDLSKRGVNCQRGEGQHGWPGWEMHRV